MSTRFTRSCPLFAFQDEDLDKKFVRILPRMFQKMTKYYSEVFLQRFKKDETEAIGNLEESLQFSGEEDKSKHFKCCRF